MSTDKSNYTKEFRENAVRLALSSDKSRAAIARELGIPDWTLRDWVRTYIKQSEQNGSKPAVDELLQLQKENRQLKLENDILKKAAAYFAKHQV